MIPPGTHLIPVHRTCWTEDFRRTAGEFCIGIGDGLNFLLTSFGCDLNAIIFGRVGGASARTGDVALFSFDMGTGNIYGLVGMAMYGYLRNLVFTLMVPVFLYYLVGFLYSNGNPRVKERLLGMTKLFVAAASVLFCSRSFWELLYTREMPCSMRS